MEIVFMGRIQLPEWTLLQLYSYSLLYINYLKQGGLLGKLEIFPCSVL